MACFDSRAAACVKVYTDGLYAPARSHPFLDIPLEIFSLE